MSATLSSPFGGDVAALHDAARDETSLRRFLQGLPGVDQVGAEARAAGLATRSIKTTSKAWALDTAVRMVDLTTLEGADTPGKVRSLCAKAVHPDPSDASTPSVAAVMMPSTTAYSAMVWPRSRLLNMYVRRMKSFTCVPPSAAMPGKIVTSNTKSECGPSPGRGILRVRE